MIAEKQMLEFFPSFQKDLINNIEQHCTLMNAKAGDIIIKTGQYIRNTVLVVKGKIKIYREDEEGNEFFMYYLLSGQACAISMICATKAETSQIMAKVEEDAELIMIPLHLMDKWMTEFKSWYEFVIETYKSRFEEVLLVIDQIAFRGMDERLEFYLKRNAKANATKDIQASHQDIANDLSTSREVISRLLKKMEQRGYVKLHRSHIELLK
jgi:CRP/FNR family transcriptional regulator